jgi:hypothetical protein
MRTSTICTAGEKAAQANIIRRREETNATRSALNTAKLIEDNPILMRLKELEALEKVTEKIDKLTVIRRFGRRPESAREVAINLMVPGRRQLSRTSIWGLT